VSGGATASIRTATLRELLAQIGDHPDVASADVVIIPGAPGADWAEEMIWVYSIEGQEDYPTMMAGVHERDDNFTITLRFRSATRGLDQLEASDRVEKYLNAAAYVVADGCWLQGNVDGLGEITTGAKVGPFSLATKFGYEARAELDVHCQTRISA